jgi:hypothetical protein
MKTKIILMIYLSFVSLIFFFTIVYAVDRNFLFNEFNAKNGLKGLMNINEWRTKLIDKINHELQQISASDKENIIANADGQNQNVWPTLEVTQYLDFVKNGNRDHYEKSVSDRRARLEKLVTAELLANNGKYMNQIVNGLWLTLEESTWVYPAHLFLQKAGSGLPDPEQPVIDLFTAEAANQISFIELLLGIFFIDSYYFNCKNIFKMIINDKRRKLTFEVQ